MQTKTTEIIRLEDLEAAEWIEGAELIDTDLADVEQQLADDAAALQDSLPTAIGAGVFIVAVLAAVIL